MNWWIHTHHTYAGVPQIVNVQPKHNSLWNSALLHRLSLTLPKYHCFHTDYPLADLKNHIFHVISCICYNVESSVKEISQDSNFSDLPRCINLDSIFPENINSLSVIFQQLCDWHHLVLHCPQVLSKGFCFIYFLHRLLHNEDCSLCSDSEVCCFLETKNRKQAMLTADKSLEAYRSLVP